MQKHSLYLQQHFLKVSDDSKTWSKMAKIEKKAWAIAHAFCSILANFAQFWMKLRIF